VVILKWVAVIVGALAVIYGTLIVVAVWALGDDDDR
jgi:hypothetical protein